MSKVGFLQALSGAITPRQKGLSMVPSGRGGWWPIVRESFAGAWQRNVEVNQTQVLGSSAVFSCITLIASDVAKLRVKLVEQDADGIWTETDSASFSPVLRKPNPIQNRIQFWESWIISKLAHGNTYVLKVRDGRGVVIRLHVLDPTRVKPLVSDDGAVFYEISQDNLSGVTEQIVVPAREIIHDRMNCLFHPLVGVSPIFANGLAATQGLKIQELSAKFFGNNARPSGILTAPAHIDPETAERLKAHWESEYTGESGAGKVAVLGDGLKFESMTMTAVDAQLIDQLKWSAQTVCSTYHVPPYKIGVGEMPKYDNIQSLNVEYFTQCLQALIESAELCLDEGLGIGAGVKLIDGKVYGTEFDVDGLLRMDSITQMEVLEKSKGVMSPNEQRRKLDLKPKAGGDSPMIQQQNYSLSALAKRDAQSNPFETSSASPPAAAAAVEQSADRLAAKKNAGEALARRAIARAKRDYAHAA